VTLLAGVLLWPAVVSGASIDTTARRSATPAAAAADATQINRLAAAAVSPVADATYAARESASPELQSFAGGRGGLYIGGSGVAIVLLIVLLILIL
jgi:hypothetical protein